MKKTNSYSSISIELIILSVLNFLVSLIVVLILLTNIPNPLPLVFVVVLYLGQIVYFRKSILKIVALFILFIFTFHLMIPTMDTNAITMKCASETNKPYDNRDLAKIQKETENFEACLDTITFTDYIVFGLLKW